MMYRALIFIFLFSGWLLFSGLFDVFHVALGILASAWVTWMSSDLLFQNRQISLAGRWRQLTALPGYGVWLLGQIVVANWHILLLVMTPGAMNKLDPRIVRFRTGLTTDFGKFLLAQSITLTPGTVTVKIVGDEFYVHAISQRAADGLDGSMEKRIAAIFEHVHPSRRKGMA